jgi:hypothetical protein
VREPRPLSPIGTEPATPLAIRGRGFYDVIASLRETIPHSALAHLHDLLTQNTCGAHLPCRPPALHLGSVAKRVLAKRMTAAWAGADRVGVVFCHVAWRWGFCLAEMAIRIYPYTPLPTDRRATACEPRIPLLVPHWFNQASAPRRNSTFPLRLAPDTSPLAPYRMTDTTTSTGNTSAPASVP